MYLALRLAFTCLIACAVAGCSDGVSGARFRYVAEGGGTTNAEPLEPLRPGSVIVRDDAPGSVATVEDEVEIEGTRVRRVLHGTDAAWYAVTDEGVFLVGPDPQSGGKRAHPILLVPAVVRMGLAWDVWLDDESGDDTVARYHFVVSDRSDDVTLEGRHPRWRIDQVDTLGDGQSGGAAGGALTRRFYLEGRGLAEESGPLGVVKQHRAVFPLDEAQGSARRIDERVALSPLPPELDPASTDPAAPTVGPSGEAVITGAPIASLSMVHPRGADRATLPVALADGLFRCLATDGRTLRQAPVAHHGGAPGEGGGWQITDGACPAVRACDGPRTCRDVLPSTGAHALVSDEVWWNHAPSQGTGGSFDGATYALLAVPPAVPLPVLLALDERTAEGPIPGRLVAGAGTFFAGHADPGGLSAGVPLDNTLVALRRPLVRVLPDAHDARNASLLLQTDDGRFASAQLMSGALTPPVAATTFGGRVVVAASERGNDLLYLTGDGSIDALDVSGDAPIHAHLADLALPAGERLLGAFRLAGAESATLVVVTAAPPVEQRQVARFWRVPSFAPAPATLTRARGFAVTLSPAAGADDVEVCWPRGGTADLAGWTLGGALARAVIPLGTGGNCALVLSAVRSTPGTTPPADRYLVEAAVPGAGRLALAMPADSAPPAILDGGNDPVAALAAGGFTSLARRFGVDALAASTPAGALADRDPAALADAAGHGLWHALAPVDGKNANAVMLVGARTQRFAYTDPASGEASPLRPRFVAGAGGLVAETLSSRAKAWVLLSPDGKVTLLPVPPLPGEVTPLGLAPDGTLCGTVMEGGALDVWCRGPQGPLRRTAAVDLRRPLPTTWWPLPDGTFAGIAADGTLRFDPGRGAGSPRMTLELLAPRPIARPAYAADGTLWAIVDDAAVQVTPSGLVKLDPPPGLAPTSPHLARLAVDARLLTALYDDGSALRLLRPQ